MKRSLSVLLLLLAAAILRVQAQGTELAAPIQEVKLHLAGAEITSRISVVLQPGRNQFVVPDLSSKIYPQTIQVDCSEPVARIVSVTCKTNFLRKTKEDLRIEALRDSVDIVRAKIAALNDERGALEEERELLRQNRQIKGDDKTLTMAELKAAADFFRQRNEEVNRSLSRINLGLEQHHRLLFDLRLQLNELNANLQPTNEIYLVLESPRVAKAELELRYVVSDAGWAAIYDLESGDLSASTIDLTYRALAFNNSGVDWNNVKLTLSTADPLQTAEQPHLAVWNLNEYSADQIQAISNLSISNTNAYSNGLKGTTIQSYNEVVLNSEFQQNYAQQIMGDDWDSKVDYNTSLYRRYQAQRVNEPTLNRAVLDVPEFNAEFPIDQPFTIPSDKKPYSVEIDTFQLEASYKYFAVPKLDKDAFLLAQIVGWEDLNLVSGPVNIYQRNKYIGQSNLDIRNLSDTLSVSLGRDKDVVVTRLKVKGKTSNQLLGGTRKSTVAYNISVRNNHQTPIFIQVQDQVPISSDKEVIVTIDELGGGLLDDKVGVVCWDKTLQPGETKTSEFGFTIRYPKTKAVHIEYKKSRQMEQMRYF